MMKLRRVMKLPVTHYLKEEDFQLFEEDNFVSADLKALGELLKNYKVEVPAPVFYGGDCITRDDIFQIFKNLILNSYGNLEEDNFVYLGVLNYSTNFIIFGNGSIKNNTTLEIDSTPVLIFEEGDSTLFNGFVVSPFGKIPGAENFEE